MNQRIAKLHYMLDDLDALYTEIQNGGSLSASQAKQELVENYQNQRRQFEDYLSFILPPISTPHDSIMELPSLIHHYSTQLQQTQSIDNDNNCDNINNNINDNQLNDNNNDNNDQTISLNVETISFLPQCLQHPHEIEQQKQLLIAQQKLQQEQEEQLQQQQQQQQQQQLQDNDNDNDDDDDDDGDVNNKHDVDNMIDNLNIDKIANNDNINNTYFSTHHQNDNQFMHVERQREPGAVPIPIPIQPIQSLHSTQSVQSIQSLHSVHSVPSNIHSVQSGHSQSQASAPFVSNNQNQNQNQLYVLSNPSSINDNNNNTQTQSKIDTNSSSQYQSPSVTTDQIIPSVNVSQIDDDDDEYQYSDESDQDNKINAHTNHNISKLNVNMNNINGTNHNIAIANNKRKFIHIDLQNYYSDDNHDDNDQQNNIDIHNNDISTQKLSHKLSQKSKSIRPPPPKRAPPEPKIDNKNQYDQYDDYHHNDYHNNKYDKYGKNGYDNHQKDQNGNNNHFDRSKYYGKKYGYHRDYENQQQRNPDNNDQKYDYDCDYDDEDDGNNNNNINHSYNYHYSRKLNNNDNDIKDADIPDDNDLAPAIIRFTPYITDLDSITIQNNLSRVLKVFGSGREKIIKSSIGHLLKFCKCGISSEAFLTAYRNYFGYELELKYVPKCNGWNEFLLKCTWRKQIKDSKDDNDNDSYIYTKYASQYPHIYGLKHCNDNIVIKAVRGSDTISYIINMLNAFPCGVICTHLLDIFQLYYGSLLSYSGDLSDLSLYFSQYLICGKFYTYIGNNEYCDNIYLTENTLSELNSAQKYKLRTELLYLFFYRSPSGILESELAYVYRQTYKSSIYLINTSLYKYICDELSEYIECTIIKTDNKSKSDRRLYYFRSFFGLPHTINKLLKNLSISLRCKWISSKITSILSLFRQGIEWSCLVRAVQYYGNFSLSQSLFISPNNSSSASHSPPSCIYLLRENMDDLHIKNDSHNNSKICYLKSQLNLSLNRRKNIHPVIDQQDVYSYYDLIINLLKEDADRKKDKKKQKEKQKEDTGLTIEQIESRFNAKYDKFRLNILTPLIIREIRTRIDEELYIKYCKFKYDPYQFISTQKPKHWKHPYRNYKKSKYTNNTTTNSGIIVDGNELSLSSASAKWRQKSNSVSPSAVSVSVSVSVSAHSDVSGSSINDSFAIKEVCLITGLSSFTELNGVSVTLCELLPNKLKWKVIINNGSKAGEFQNISIKNLKKFNDYKLKSKIAKKQAKNDQKMNDIIIKKVKRKINKDNDNNNDDNKAATATSTVTPINSSKITLINIHKTTTRAHIIYKLSKTFGVRILYCSSIICDPFNLKSNFIPKIEFESIKQVDELIQKQNDNLLLFDRRNIKIINYYYKYSDYKIIAKWIFNRISVENKGRISLISLYNLYKNEKDSSFQNNSMSLIEFCQLIERERTIMYFSVKNNNSIRLICDQKIIRNDKIAKMIRDLINENKHIISPSSSSSWTLKQFKKKWSQKYNTNLNESIFGKYRSFIHFLNEIQSKYIMSAESNRKKIKKGNSIKFKISLRTV